MSKLLDKITDELDAFIKAQKMFFVATAAATGRVNVSPKGMDSFSVINANKIVWLNLTGSGNETAAHLLQNDRMTIMFCAFEGKPLILRLYGHAVAYHQDDEVYKEYIGLFDTMAGARQIIVMEVDLVQTSCGFAVPLMDYREQRQILKNWAEQKGPEQIEAYWKKNNIESIDGFDTGMDNFLN